MAVNREGAYEAERTCSHTGSGQGKKAERRLRRVCADRRLLLPSCVLVHFSRNSKIQRSVKLLIAAVTVCMCVCVVCMHLMYGARADILQPARRPPGGCPAGRSGRTCRLIEGTTRGTRAPLGHRQDLVLRSRRPAGGQHLDRMHGKFASKAAWTGLNRISCEELLLDVDRGVHPSVRPSDTLLPSLNHIF